MINFEDVTMSLSKIAKDCVMRITSTKLYFIVSDEEGGPKQPLVWCELPINYYFREYTVAGVSEEYNEIYLELCTGKQQKIIYILNEYSTDMVLLQQC